MGLIRSVRDRRQTEDELTNGGETEPASKKTRMSNSGLVRIGQDARGEGVESMYKELPDTVRSKVFKFERTDYVVIDTHLWYVPIQHSVNAIFTKQLQAYVKNMVAANHFKIGQIVLKSMKIRNPIVLSDEIQITASGSTEVSSFVQSAKILHYRLGGDCFAAHAYSFSKNQTVLQMKAEDLVGGKDENSAYLLASFEQSNEMEKIEVQALKIYQDLAVVCDEIKNSAGEQVKIPAQIGYLRLPEQTALQVTPQYMQQNSLSTRFLKSMPHDYLQPGREIDIALADNLRFTNAETLNNLSGEMFTYRGLAKTKQPLFYTYPGFNNQTCSYANNNRYVLAHHAASRRNWHVHDYFTIVPIKNSAGSNMKIRANVEINFDFEIHLLYTGNSFDFDSSSQFNVELDTPWSLPMRETYIDAAKKNYCSFVFH